MYNIELVVNQCYIIVSIIERGILLNIFILTTLIYSAIFIIFTITIYCMIKLNLARRQDRKAFAKYYSLVSKKEIKQKQQKIIVQICKNSYITKQQLLLSIIIYMLIIFILLFSLFFSINHLSIMFILIVDVLVLSLLILLINLIKKIKQSFYLYINENSTNINLKENEKYLFSLANSLVPTQLKWYNFITLSLVMSIILSILLIVIKHLFC